MCQSLVETYFENAVFSFMVADKIAKFKTCN